MSKWLGWVKATVTVRAGGTPAVRLAPAAVAQRDWGRV